MFSGREEAEEDTNVKNMCILEQIHPVCITCIDDDLSDLNNLEITALYNCNAFEYALGYIKKIITIHS